MVMVLVSVMLAPEISLLGTTCNGSRRERHADIDELE